jgi:cytochrome c oxidase subunit 2
MEQIKYGWWLPPDISTRGWEIDRLIYVIHIFMAVLFVGWLVFYITAIVKFRARTGHKADYKIDHFRLPKIAEVFVALFEAVLLVGFSFPVFFRAKNEQAMPSRGEALEVRMVAEQFAWNFHYPGEDGLFGKTAPDRVSAVNPVGLDENDPAGKDDIVSINQFHIPVNRPVIVNLSSKDVIHSFFIPVMRVKQDVIPGMVIPTWFEAKKTGQFEIACAQLCGLGHYRMRGFFTVDSEEDFRKWLDENKPVSSAPEPAAGATQPVAAEEAAPPEAPAHGEGDSQPAPSETHS